MKTYLSTAVPLCLGLGLIAPGSASAQDNAAPSPFTASLAVGGYYTDNVYYSRPLYDQARLGDWVTVIQPSIGYNYAFENGRINLGANAEIGRFTKYSSEDYVDFNGYADGQYRFNPSTFAVWGMSFGRDHEARDSIEPSDQIGAHPTQYWKASAYGAISHRIGDDFLKLGLTYDGYDFLDQASVNNDDRDRNMGTVGARYTHSLGDGQSIYGEATADVRRYVDSTDDNGFMRDSQGFRAVGGWQANVGEYGRAELYGGLLYQDYRDPSFSDVVTPDFGGRYSWAFQGTSITADLRRSLEETTLSGVSSYLTTRGTLRLAQDLPNNIRVYGGASLAELDFQDSGRRDQISNFWLGARKYMTPHLYAGLEASFEERESDDPVNDYTESRIMARVGLDTERAFNPDEAGTMYGPSSFYVGVGGEISQLVTMLDGPRQNTNGSLTADFAGLGPAGRIIAGWGTDIDKIYLGVEGDFRMSNTGWNHSRLPGGRVFSVDEKNSLGLSLLAGRRLAGGALVYGRAGIRGAQFDTYYATAGASASYSDWLTGFEYGLGVSAPITPNLALALEYVQTRYSDYQATAGNNTPDRFGNVDNSVRLALNYHIGGIPGTSDQTLTDMNAYAGAYWGLQGGLGGIVSANRGNRDAGSVLNADRGDSGFTAGGLFGYNFVANRFVFGGEVDGAVAREAWNQKREPNGRNYSLTKNGEIGVSGRVGYVLDGGYLIYGRAGAVVSHFSKDFKTTGTTLSDDDWEAALRFGGGMEVPLPFDGSRLRFDYSYTDYGTLSLATGSGPETFDTQESLFRVGFLKSF